MKKMGLVRGILLAGLLLAVVAGVGYSAPGGSQTVSIAAAARIDLTVPATASIASADPTACGTTFSTINVKANKPWNLQIRSEPLGYPTGKAKNGLVELTNAFQYNGGDVVPFTNVTSTYASLFGANQAKTASRDVIVNYQQCVTYLDDPGTYTIVVEYLGI